MSELLLKREDHQVLGDDTTFSDHPHSEFTSSGPASSKKRANMAFSQHDNLPVQSRLYGSEGATTTGHPAVVTAAVTLAPMFSGHFVSSLNSQSFDTDALVRLQMKRLQSGVEILRRKHCRDLLSVVQQQVVKRLRVKEVELESLNQRNRELEENLRQMSDQCQVWFNYAKSAETVVSHLRERLDNVLTNQNTCPALEEGYGENVDKFPVGDTESVCQEDVDTALHGGWRVCRGCQQWEACVLLLPFRHLCLCKGCESIFSSCPVCSSGRNASIQVAEPILRSGICELAHNLDGK